MRERLALFEQSGLFDRAWYLDRNPDIARSGRDPLGHLAEHGAMEWRDPGPGFDSAFYAAQNPSFAETGLSPLEHYLRIGQAAGAAPTKPRDDDDGGFATLVSESGLFDAEWYLARNSDVRDSGLAPFDHLIRAGAKEWRDPGPGFESAFYAAQNPAYADTGLSPLEHYLRIGREAGAAATKAVVEEAVSFADLVTESGLFDADWYLARNSDVRRSGVDPFDHLIKAGANEWRDPGPGFEAKFYAKRSPTLSGTGMTPLEHYLRVGRAAGIVPTRKQWAENEFRALLKESGLFDEEWYLARNPDVRKSGFDPLEHVVRSGAREWRDPGPNFEATAYAEQSPDYPGDDTISPLEHYLRFGQTTGAVIKAPTYGQWSERFDRLDEGARAWIAADAQASPLPAIVCLHLPGPDGDGAADARRACDEQIGASPALRLVGRGDGLTGPAEALDACADGTVAILTAGRASLRPHAAYAFAASLVRDTAEAAYSDHDHRDEAGERSRPVFKPAMSPDLMVQIPYAGPVVAVRITASNRAAVASALDHALDGDPSVAFAGLLRAMDRSQVRRVPLCLFSLPLSAGADTEGVEGVFEVIPGRRQLPPVVPVMDEPPQVRILIPTRDRRELLEACIESILSRTDYPRDRYRIVVIDNDTREPESVAYLASLADEPNCEVVPAPGPFNFSRICNTGAAGTDGDVLVFLNNDITVIEADWLTTLAAQAARPDVGAVGAKLLYPDDTIQHGGVLLGMHGVAAHRLLRLTVEEAEPLDATREMTTVTGACLAIRRSVFEAVGGFDPVLAVAFNDTVLCMRTVEAGFRNLYVARPLLYHHESKSRGFDDSPEKLAVNRREAIYARARHAAFFQDDPSYNPNLSLQKIGALGVPPRIMPPWRRSAERRRVLLLSSGHGLGHGVGCVVAMQAEKFLSRGWAVTVGGPIGERDRAYPGCERVRLVTPVQAAAYAVAEGFDCVVAHTPPFFSASRFLGHRPLFYIYDHGEPTPALFENREARELIDWEKRFCAPLARRVFAISQAIFDEQFRPDALVLRNGNTHLSAWSRNWAERRHALRRKFGFEGRFVVLNVCRFHESERRYKGVDLYASVAAETPYAIPAMSGRATFVLAGRGNEADIAHVRRSGLTAFANITDEEMAELYAASDLYVSLSQWEGYNLGIGQALAMGLDVLASDIPAHREFGVPASNSVPKLCGWVGEAFGRWDETAAGRAARLETWDTPLTRFVDIIEEDLVADRAGPWL